MTVDQILEKAMVLATDLSIYGMLQAAVVIIIIGIMVGVVRKMV